MSTEQSFFDQQSRRHWLCALLKGRSEYNDLLELTLNSPPFIPQSLLLKIHGLAEVLYIVVDDEIKRHRSRNHKIFDSDSNRVSLILDIFKSIDASQSDERTFYFQNIRALSEILDQLNFIESSRVQILSTLGRGGRSPSTLRKVLNNFLNNLLTPVGIVAMASILAVIFFIITGVFSDLKEKWSILNKIQHEKQLGVNLPDVVNKIQKDLEEIINLNARLATLEEEMGKINPQNKNIVIGIYGKIGSMSEKRTTLPNGIRFSHKDKIITLDIPYKSDVSVYNYLIGRKLHVSLFSCSLLYRRSGVLARVDLVTDRKMNKIPVLSAKDTSTAYLENFPIIGLATNAVFKELGFPDPLVPGYIDVEILIYCPPSIAESIMKSNAELRTVSKFP